MTLVLGPGLAAGLGGIGALLAFGREGIPVRACIGANTGALVAALWAAGADLPLAARVLAHLPWAEYLGARPLETPDRLLAAIELLTRRLSFADAPGRVGVAVGDLAGGRAAVVRHGSIARAVRESLSIPGLIGPVPGGGVDPGAEWARAVRDELARTGDAGSAVWTTFAPVGPIPESELDDAGLSGPVRDLARYAFMNWLATAPKGPEVIAARVEGLGPLSFDRAEEWVAAGAEAAEAWLRRHGGALR